jgi:nicotinate phosphoribosyltransferase
MTIDPRDKMILFSDALNLDKALALKKQCDEIGFKGIFNFCPVPHEPYSITLASFGIGTYLTNDFRTQSSGGKDQSKALNMVIKIASVNGLPCVKISDDLMKVRNIILGSFVC